jgi:hypothetical protein
MEEEKKGWHDYSSEEDDLSKNQVDPDEPAYPDVNTSPNTASKRYQQLKELMTE